MRRQKKTEKYRNKLSVAAQEYVNRQNRTTHPSGSFDNAGRWYPAHELSCCEGIRAPSRAYPYSLLVHCRTMRHIANEFDIELVDLRKQVRSMVV